MLIYNLRRALNLRGIDKPHAFLVRNGFSRATATNMLVYYPVVFKVRSLEKLCIALNCTPNDLFEWRDKENSALPAEHALNGLRKEAVRSFAEIVNSLPLEKMSEVEAFLDNLKKEG